MIRYSDQVFSLALFQLTEMLIRFSKFFEWNKTRKTKIGSREPALRWSLGHCGRKIGVKCLPTQRKQKSDKMEPGVTKVHDFEKFRPIPIQYQVPPNPGGMP